MTSFQTMYCNGNIRKVGRFDIKVEGRIDDTIQDNEIYYIAATPADHRATFTGSGLPFANQLQAFDNTPNSGSVTVTSDNSFEIYLLTPNSYMIGLGSVQVPPTLYISYINGNGESRVISIQVAQGIPYRSMTYPMDPRARDGPEFYDSQFYLPVRSQETILIEAGYPRVNTMPKNHWGSKPPL